MEDLNKVGHSQEQLDRSRLKMKLATSRADWERAARLKYKISQLERQLASTEPTEDHRGG